MILMSITAEGKTFYITDIANGAMYNGQWYDPWVLDSTDISWGGGAFASLQLGSISVITGKTNGNGDSLKDIQSYIEWNVNVKWTDYNLATVTDIFTGVAILRDKNQFTFELKFKTEDFRNENYNLLTPAPNLIINDGEYQGDFVDNNAISVTGEGLKVSFALGSTFLAPLDNQSIIDTTVSITNTTKSVSLVESTDFTIDYASGIITVSDTTDVDDGDVLSIDYDYSKYLANAVVYYSGVYYQNTKTDGGHSVSPPTSPWVALSTSTVFSDGRVHPIAFGVLGDSYGTYTGRQGFFARPLLLNQTKYLYWSAYGDVKKTFDDGVEVTFTKKSDNIFQLDERPVGEISMFVDGGIGIVEETITGTPRRITTTTYHQYIEPDPANIDLIIGDIWYNTSDNNKQYIWNGAQWFPVTDGRVDAGLNDDGNVKKSVNGFDFTDDSANTGLNLAQSYMGYYSGSAWSAYIQKEGNFYFGDGGTTLGTNNYLAYYNIANGIGGGGTPNTFVISTPQFKVDVNGNATFSGELSAATGTFSGEVKGADILILNPQSYYCYTRYNTNLTPYKSGNYWLLPFGFSAANYSGTTYKRLYDTAYGDSEYIMFGDIKHVSFLSEYTGVFRVVAGATTAKFKVQILDSPTGSVISTSGDIDKSADNEDVAEAYGLKVLGRCRAGFFSIELYIASFSKIGGAGIRPTVRIVAYDSSNNEIDDLATTYFNLGAVGQVVNEVKDNLVV